MSCFAASADSADSASLSFDRSCSGVMLGTSGAASGGIISDQVSSFGSAAHNGRATSINSAKTARGISTSS
ncbi:hypothetical protein D3C73_1487080 [compost metagenome]